MYRLLLFVLSCAGFSEPSFIVDPGPKYPATKGEAWPKPQWENKEESFYSFDRNKFNITVTSLSCEILTNNVNRYIDILNKLDQTVRRIKESQEVNTVQSSSSQQDSKYRGIIRELKVELTSPCEVYPHLDMVENYELVVAATSTLNSSSIWGIIRGLETFAQLFYVTDDFTQIRINATHIMDFPNYPHRGLLVDTSRHYISVHGLLQNLDAMAINKMNVFHWHIVDDQSFPYQSEKFPNLSELGAFNPMAVYTKQDIEKIVEEAKNRGIRVIPEFDVPGHTTSWGNAYPNILTKCYRNGNFVGLGPMNPINNNTYKILQELFLEIHERFPDKYIHVGGDEVEMECWLSNPEIIKYMEEHQIASPSELHALFMRTAIPLLERHTTPIVWQEVFDNDVPLSNETIVHVWKGWNDREEISGIVNRGHRVLYSSAWYLDHLDKSWQSMYQADPRSMLGPHPLAKNVLGGEACMWAEMVDDTNFLSRVWPRASAVAERLWSAAAPNSMSWTRRNNRGVPDREHRRMEEHTCRMRSRGVPASPPSGPGFCALATL